MDPIFSPAGGLENVYPGFYERPDGPQCGYKKAECRLDPNRVR